MKKKNLPNLLHSISLLNYPKELVEIILVDDDSEEVFSVQDLVFSLKVIKNDRKSNSPKKDAIETAIQVAKTIGLLLPMRLFDSERLVDNFDDNIFRKMKWKWWLLVFVMFRKNGFIRFSEFRFFEFTRRYDWKFWNQPTFYV